MQMPIIEKAHINKIKEIYNFLTEERSEDEALDVINKTLITQNEEVLKFMFRNYTITQGTAFIAYRLIHDAAKGNLPKISQKTMIEVENRFLNSALINPPRFYREMKEEWERIGKANPHYTDSIEEIIKGTKIDYSNPRDEFKISRIREQSTLVYLLVEKELEKLSQNR